MTPVQMRTEQHHRKEGELCSTSCWLLPLLGLLAAYGIVVLIVLSVPFCLGGFFQLVLTIAAGDRWAVWVPAGLGVLGLALSFLFLLGAIPWGGILL